MALQCSLANRLVDGLDFSEFSCSDGERWCDEAERHIQRKALRDRFALAFRDEDGTLVAVSSFNARRIDVTPGACHDGWHLEVVGIARSHQQQGLAAEVFAETFAQMQKIAPERRHVSAYVHESHMVSRLVAERAGLEYLLPREDGYIVLLAVL